MSDSKKISIETCFSKAFDVSKGFKRTYFLAILIVAIAYLPIFALMTAVQFLGGNFDTLSDPAINELNLTQFSIRETLFLLLDQIIPIFLGGPLMVSLSMLAVKRIRAEQAESGEVLNYFQKILPLFFTTLIMYVLIMLGFMFFILPGIYLSVAYAFSLILVADKNLSPWQALETSRKAVSKQWFKVAFCFLGAILFFAISIIPLGIGLLWSIPWSALVIAYLYQQLFVDTPEINNDTPEINNDTPELIG